MPIERIISGGQTGADQAGLAAAKHLGLKTGGWMPKGYRTEAGPRPEFLNLYGMLEHTDHSYLPRTALNVLQSGGTLVFGNQYSSGSSLTISLGLRKGKDIFVCPWNSGQPTPPTEPFFDWLSTRSWTTLNVAGNRESKNPGIFDACKDFLITTFTKHYLTIHNPKDHNYA